MASAFSAGSDALGWPTVSVWDRLSPPVLTAAGEVKSTDDSVSTQAATNSSVALDRTDIARSLHGDQDAFRRLIERHQASVATTMWRFTRDRRLYEELVHNVFVEAFLNLGKYRGEGEFGGWLRKIAVRIGFQLWKEQTRLRARRTVRIDDCAEPQVAEPEPRRYAEQAEMVFGLLSELPPRDRLVLTLMYVEQKSVAECSEVTGWSRAMVKMQALRARRKLEKLLNKQSRQSRDRGG
jgi:RNA polymerase sigma-70 factor (ECF subfamily)